jgi:acetoin utilization deacetylase AcuC-like enzyme
MKIVFHQDYIDYAGYASDPAADRGRIKPIIKEIREKTEYEIITPEPATEEDILRAHSERHLRRIKHNNNLYYIASLAAGGAIKTAEIAYDNKEAAFGVIRPPGHHASADSCWGFCFFNNMSISLLKLIADKKIKTAFILDFDLHTGDGNINIIGQDPNVKILNPRSPERVGYLEEIDETFKSLKNIDIVAASAGFDEYVLDWGGTLTTEDYMTIGKMMKEYSLELCEGRRYAILEGGYYFEHLGINVVSFCKGFE